MLPSPEGFKVCTDQRPFVFHPVTFSVAAEIVYGDTTQFESVLSQAGASINKRLLDIVCSQYSLMLHCTAIKQYILMGQGLSLPVLIAPQVLTTMQATLSSTSLIYCSTSYPSLQRSCTGTTSTTFSRVPCVRRLATSSVRMSCPACKSGSSR